MYELGYSFEYKQKGKFSVIFDLDNQIVLYQGDKHIPKKNLVIFSRLISESEELELRNLEVIKMQQWSEWKD